jgi:hypothetical protein
MWEDVGHENYKKNVPHVETESYGETLSPVI